MRRTYVFLVSGLFLVTVFSVGTVDSRFDGSLPGVAVPISDDDVVDAHNAGCHEDRPDVMSFAHNATPFGPCAGYEHMTFSLEHTLVVCPDSCQSLAFGFDDGSWGLRSVACWGPAVALIDWRGGDHVIVPPDNCAAEAAGDPLDGSYSWVSYGKGDEGIRFSHSDDRQSLLLSMPPIG